VAPRLALRLGCWSVDLDREIERLAGRSVAAIFEEDGEEHFRDLESFALTGALNRDSPVVVACGGGVLDRALNREALKTRARVIWLQVDPGAAARRLGGPGEPARPLLAGGPVEEGLRSLLSVRGPAYAQAADASVETSGLTPEEVVERIAATIARSGHRWDSSAS